MQFLGPGLVFAFAGLIAQAFKRTPIYKAASAGRMASRKDLRRYLIGAEAIDQARFHIRDIEPAAIGRGCDIMWLLKDKVTELGCTTDLMT